MLTAAALASPLPGVDDAWREVFERMSVSRPRPVSHELILQTVRDLGGYNTLDHRYRFANEPIGIIREQYIKAYTRSCEQWEERVCTSLLRGPAGYDWKLFPHDNALLTEAYAMRDSLTLAMIGGAR